VWTSRVVDASVGSFAADPEIAGTAATTSSAFVRSPRRAGSSVAKAPTLSGQWTTSSLPSRSKNDKSILANSSSGFRLFICSVDAEPVVENVAIDLSNGALISVACAQRRVLVRAALAVVVDPACHRGQRIGIVNIIGHGEYSSLPIAGSVRLRVPSAPGEVDLEPILIDADPFLGTNYDIFKKQRLGIELSENAVVFGIL
jgi:hypothetical protein